MEKNTWIQKKWQDEEQEQKAWTTQQEVQFTAFFLFGDKVEGTEVILTLCVVTVFVLRTLCVCVSVCESAYVFV